MSKHREITVRSLVALCLAAVMAVSILPVPADAATSGEIQKEIDALEEKNMPPPCNHCRKLPLN